MSRVPTQNKSVEQYNVRFDETINVTFRAGDDSSLNNRKSLFYNQRLYSAAPNLKNQVNRVRDVLSDGSVSGEETKDNVTADITIFNSINSGFQIDAYRTGSISEEKTYHIDFTGYCNYYKNETVFKVKFNGTEYNKIKLNGTVITPKA